MAIDNQVIISIFGGFMLWLAIRDHWTFLSGEHVDYQSIIVSIGIFGTFIGIVVGLVNFNTSNIVASVPFLLEGLKFAFITSIIGMGLSIFLSVLQAQPEVKDNQLERVNQTLAAILEDIKQLRADIYQRRYRFSKLDAEGQILAEDARQWMAIIDNETGFMWEMKTNDGGLQDGKNTYTDTIEYVENINEMQLATYNDWCLPTIMELETLIKDQGIINKRYFPNIHSGWYCSSTPNDEIEGGWLVLSFETANRGYNNGYGHILLMRKLSSL
jgi:hypothetical protein